MNSNICILLIILIILISLIIVFYISNNESFESQNKISVIILSYNRPKNLEKNLPILNSINIIDEIIVSHGSANFFKEFKYSKVKNIKDYNNNNLYGAARRFFNIKYTKNNIILFIDDDVYIDEKNLNKLYKKFQIEYKKNTIYGAAKRLCNKNGYFGGDFLNYNIILPHVLITKKSIINEFLNNKIGWNKYEAWFIKNKGNCEDLALNIFIKEYYNENPILVNIKYHELDITNGYSSIKNHYNKRDEFCKLYSII